MSSSRTTLVLSAEFPTFAGGIGTLSYEIARNWHEMGEQVVAVAPYYGECDREFDAAQGFRIIRVNEGTFKLTKFTRRLQAVRRALAEVQPDAIFATDWRAGLVALIASRGKMPIVIEVHGAEFITPGGEAPMGRIEALVRRFVMGAVLRRAKRILCNSEYTRRLTIEAGMDPDRLDVAFVGSYPEKFVPVVDRVAAKRRFGWEGRRAMLTVARLAKRKGHETVLRALPSIVQRVPDVLYVIAGTGREEAPLAQLAADLGVVEHVQFLGRVAEEDLPSLHAASDVFVLASTDDPKLEVEGFGIVLLDASSCERPVVATRAGGIPEAVEDGVTGILVTPGSADQIADAVVKILKDPELAQRMGRAGRERVISRFTWRRVAEDSLKQLYGDAVLTEQVAAPCK